MKKKSLIIITVCLAITLCVAAIGVAFAWYTSSAGADNQFELNADGYLVVYFDENEYTLDTIKPAVAKKGAINDNVTDFNVLEVGENVVEAATVVSKEGMLRYINESDKQSNKAEMAITCDVYMIFEDGSKEKLSLEYDLSVKIELEWTYLGGSTGDGNTFIIGEDDWKTPSKTKFIVDDSADITLTTTMYLRQVDDLCYPSIRNAEKIQVSIQVVVIPETDEEGEQQS